MGTEIDGSKVEEMGILGVVNENWLPFFPILKLLLGPTEGLHPPEWLLVSRSSVKVAEECLGFCCCDEDALCPVNRGLVDWEGLSPRMLRFCSNKLELEFMPELNSDCSPESLKPVVVWTLEALSLRSD